jgi:hypothetical protein
MKLISVRDHKRENRGLLSHKAIAVVEDYKKEDKHRLVEEVSIECRYHPLGYGIYGESTVVPTGTENEYLVYWRTGTHCD